MTIKGGTVATPAPYPLSKSGGTMTGDINMGNNKITGLGTPTADADAATKAYADTKAPGGYGYGGYAIALPADGRTDSEAELETALVEIYGTMKDTETKLVYWNGYPAAGTSTHGWFGILVRSSINNGGFFGWSAYDSGTTIRKVKYSGTWQPLEIMATTAYVQEVADKKVDMVIGYTRSNTTSSQGSGAITLTTPLTGCTHIGIVPYWDINNVKNMPMWFGKIGDTGYLSGINPDGDTVQRHVQATSTTSVTFGPGYKGSTSENKYCIPRYIIGFKGVG